MGETLKIICTICARGGSKGVPSKNIKLLNGKPLIAHTILLAKKSGLFDRVAVSSDSQDILKISKRWGADYLIKRPAHLATDNAPKVPAIQHCVAEVERVTGMTFDLICDLDPTSPFRTIGDIRGCIDLLKKTKAPNVITGALARKSPYFNLAEKTSVGTVKLSKAPRFKVVRRQDSPICYDLNASIYLWTRRSLKQGKVFNLGTRLYEMPRERSIEIDTPYDFKVAELFAEGLKS